MHRHGGALWCDGGWNQSDAQPQPPGGARGGALSGPGRPRGQAAPPAAPPAAPTAVPTAAPTAVTVIAIVSVPANLNIPLTVLITATLTLALTLILTRARQVQLQAAVIATAPEGILGHSSSTHGHSSSTHPLTPGELALGDPRGQLWDVVRGRGPGLGAGLGGRGPIATHWAHAEPMGRVRAEEHHDQGTPTSSPYL